METAATTGIARSAPRLALTRLGSRNYAGWRIACTYSGTIAAFDREREEAHELTRRHHEIIARLRRNDRLITQEDNDRDQ